MEYKTDSKLMLWAGNNGGAGSNDKFKPPAVVALPPGTRPTEPGLYAFKDRHGRPNMMEVLPYGRDDELVGYLTGNWQEQKLSNFTFIARIYPDRIGQE